MAYDFREWASLEAIGRTGSDDGMDSRGFEVVSTFEVEPFNEEDNSLAANPATRMWIIQCKRQSTFGPKQAKQVVDDIFLGREKPHGLIVAVPANISLATRRAFAETARARGFQEFELWGKGELEDKLFWPKYDHLLFAYFGISIQIRRRTAKTRERSTLAMKKQLVKALGEISGEHYKDVLIRHPNESYYPFIQDREDFKKRKPWWYYRFDKHWPPDKVIFEVARHFAYIDPATGEWDAILEYDVNDGGYPKVWDLELGQFDPEWQVERENEAHERERFMKFHDALPEENQGTLILEGAIPYDRILAVDDIGDSVNDGPHLIVERTSGGGFFDDSDLVPKIIRYGSHLPQSFNALPEKRISKFPGKYPKLSKVQYEKILSDRMAKAKENLKKKGLQE